MFFGNFRLHVAFETSPMQQRQPLAKSSKRVWVDISNRLEGFRLTRLDPYKKTRHCQNPDFILNRKFFNWRLIAIEWFICKHRKTREKSWRLWGQI